MLFLGLGSVDAPREGCWTAEGGDLGLQGWWWLPAASQRLSDHDAFDAPLHQGGWRGSAQPGATWDPLHGPSTLPAHQGASLAALPPWELSSKGADIFCSLCT